MEFFAIVALLIVFALINIYFGRKTENNIGGNIGNKYMKDHWGIDDKEDK